MIRNKSSYASGVHGLCEIGGKKIDDWLNPENSDEELMKFMYELFGSHWFGGSDTESKFLNDLCGFGGPMFHIFTNPEKELIKRWIKANQNSPGTKNKNEHMETKVEEKNSSSSLPTNELTKRMINLIKDKTLRAKRAHGNRMMTDSKGQNLKINIWFSDHQPIEILDALRTTYETQNSKNDIQNNGFVMSISAGGGMARYFTAEEVQLVCDWIAAGSPIDYNAEDSHGGVEIPEIQREKVELTPRKTFKDHSTNISKFIIKKRHSHDHSVGGHTDFSDLTKFFHNLANMELHADSICSAKAFVSHIFTTVDQTILDNEIVGKSFKNVISKISNVQEFSKFTRCIALFMMLDGMILQNSLQAGFHHTFFKAKLTQIFMKIFGYTNHNESQFHTSDTILKITRIYLPELSSSNFFTEGGYSNNLLEFVCLQLSLSQSPHSYLPEILAISNWTFNLNKLILESLIARSKTLGIPFTENEVGSKRISYYDELLNLSKEANKMFFDELKHADDVIGYDTYRDRFNKAQSLCNTYGNRIITEMSEINSVPTN